jgi:hypothetical protein
MQRVGENLPVHNTRSFVFQHDPPINGFFRSARHSSVNVPFRRQYRSAVAPHRDLNMFNPIERETNA